MFIKSCKEAHDFARMQASATGLRHVGYATTKWSYCDILDDYIQEYGWTVKLHVEKGRTTPLKTYGDGTARHKTVKRKDLGEFIRKTTV